MIKKEAEQSVGTPITKAMRATRFRSSLFKNKIFTFHFGGLLLVACFLFCPASLSARPRPPAPPLPEMAPILFHEAFDEYYNAGYTTNHEIFVSGYGTLVQSWSGYALQRDGLDLPPFIVPGIATNGNTNLASNGSGGAFRFWLNPYWSTASGGPGYNAQLLQMIAVGSGPSVLIWSLQTTSDGSAVQLIQQSDAGPVTLVSANISWSSNEWHQVAIDYATATSGTVLYLDGTNAGSGSGITGIPPASAEIVLGSDVSGANVADADIDEFFSFGQTLPDAGVTMNYTAYSPLAALGPLSWEDDSDTSGVRSVADYSSFFSPAPSPCVTGGQVYLTNITAILATNQGTSVSFQIEGGTTNVVYDILMTTNLAPGGNATNVVWTWLGQGYTCCTYTFLNQPNTQAFYALGKPPPSMVIGWGDDSSGQCDAPFGLSNVVQVAGGLEFTLALQANGSVLAWGDNIHGETNVLSGLTNVVAIAAGAYQSLAVTGSGTVAQWGEYWGGGTNYDSVTNFSIATTPPASNVVAVAAGLGQAIALMSDGTVTAWGLDGEYGTEVPSGLTGVQAIACGWQFDLALLANGTVVAWGSDAYGETNVPTGLTNAIAIAAGALHGLALRNDGTVVAWGYNDAGQTNVPAGLSNVVSIAAGQEQSFALLADGTVVVWGEFGDVGPVFVPEGLTGVSAIGAGGYHCLALCSAFSPPVIIEQPVSQAQLPGGAVTLAAEGEGIGGLSYQWQFEGTNIAGATNSTLTLTNVQATNNGNYQVVVSDGSGSTLSSNAAFAILTPPQILSISPSAPCTNWIATNLTLSVSATNADLGEFPIYYQWQLNGTNIPGATNNVYSLSIVNTPSDLPIYSVPSSYEGAYTLSMSNAVGATNAGPWDIYAFLPGVVAGWGENNYGQLDRPATLTNVIGLAAGLFHTVVLQEDGTVLAWGADDVNQTNVPTGLSNVVAIAAGDAHSLALKADGTVVGWGFNNIGQATPPAGLTNVIAIAARANQSMALSNNGTVVTWGDILVDVPSGLTNVTAIAMGEDFCLALLGNGTVTNWGIDDLPAMTNFPANLTNVVAIAAGNDHALALTADGNVRVWGDNTYNQTNVPTNVSSGNNVMAIAAGDYHSVALLNNGTVICWGDNSDGETNVPSLPNPVKLIAAGGGFTLAAAFSPLVQYPIDVSKDLLLIYNTNSPYSTFVWSYYMANRPMIGNANVLPIGCDTNEIIGTNDLNNQILASISLWLSTNPTKRPQYLLLFKGVPTMAYYTNYPDADLAAGNYPYPTPPFNPTHEIRLLSPGWVPFVSYITMADTNDCRAYIDKIAYFGSNYSPGQLLISANAGGYAATNYPNTNYYLDELAAPDFAGLPLVDSNALAAVGVPSEAIVIDSPPSTNQITNATNVAAYFSFGGHSLNLPYGFATSGYVQFYGQSSWYVMTSYESYSGHLHDSSFSTYGDWYQSNAFGGTNYQNTPAGAVANCVECSCSQGPTPYFPLWASGKNLAICSWASLVTSGADGPLAIGDPFLKH